jgi:N-terminal region of glycosyl transferase group 7
MIEILILANPKQQRTMLQNELIKTKPRDVIVVWTVRFQRHQTSFPLLYLFFLSVCTIYYLITLHTATKLISQSTTETQYKLFLIVQKDQLVTTQEQNQLLSEHHSNSSLNMAKSEYNESNADIIGLHSIAILVPYHDMYGDQQGANHLQQFVSHMVQFLNNCVAQHRMLNDFQIYIIEQTNDDTKETDYKSDPIAIDKSTGSQMLNRGQLMNIGFSYALNKSITHSASSVVNATSGNQHDIFIFHDINLLPNDDMIDLYTSYPTTPLHLASNWPRHKQSKHAVVGDVISFNAKDFETINGVSVYSICTVWCLFILGFVRKKKLTHLCRCCTHI